MKSIADHVVLGRRATLAHTASLGGLLVLLGSVGVSMWFPTQTTLVPILLTAGAAISMVGIYYANRWVKKPRPEDTIDTALKSLSNQHRCYHYLLPEDHVLLTPGGVVVLEVCNLEGRFTYRDGRWKQRFTPSRALRFFVEETLGDPFATAQEGARAIRELVARHVSESVPVDGMVVFTNPLAEYEVEKPPLPICQPQKLTKRLPQRPKLPPEVIAQVQEVLDIAAKLSERGLADDKKRDENVITD